MTYATLCTAQKTYGVKVPYGQGSYTVHYTDEAEALEVIEGLNRAYTAGWNRAYTAGWRDALRSVEKGRHGIQNLGHTVSGPNDPLLRAEAART